MQESDRLDGAPELPPGTPAELSTVRRVAGRRRPGRQGGTNLTVVEGHGHLDEDTQVVSELVHKLAAALRAVRGYVPDPIWWDTGAAHALIEYHARRPS